MLLTVLPLISNIQSSGISSATQLPRIKRWLQRGFRPSTLWRVPLPIIPELQFADFQPTLPLVTMQFEAFPDSLFFCEQRQVLLQITVTSDVAIPAQLHISDSRSINISEDLTKMMLPPGTSVYTAAVFGYTMGACKVRLLLRYSTGAKQSLEFRTTSTTETLNVMPSLQFSVAMRPSTEHTLNHTMEITASNISDSTYFDLGKIVLINGTGSRPYTLETIGLVTTGVERSSSTNLIARAVPQIRSDETISSEFMELSSRGHRLSCHWSCENGTRSGVSELPVDLSPASEASNCPFRITVDFADIAVHDFSANLLMFVPVTIAICNSSPKSLIFDFETLSPETVFDPETRQFQTVTTSCARGRYFWSGLTKKTGTKLDANGSISFQLDACFTHPGVYTLNRFRFMLQGDVPRLFFFPSRRTIRITQKASIQAPIKS
uniref:TPPC8 C-terminal Ig-like domain-containing protein n=1 Tax=Spongospora subterranea TaxID=70186 RepID=A0A0H5R0P4_9EUKA|eukprot:CRZ01334.1 hypothetical protein [Spongospora subterranea]